MGISDKYARWRYRFFPDHLVGEVLSKEWIDNAIPVLFLIITIGVFGSLIPGFFSLQTFLNLSQQFAEISLVTLGMTIVMLGGGIDLSVGSTFALSNFICLALVNKLEWSPYLAIPTVLLVSGAVGLINGFFVGYLRLRAFLTTLATMIVVRAVVDELVLEYARTISASMTDSAAWEYLWDGRLFGMPISFIVAIGVAIFFHLVITRMRLGWRIFAIGGSRRSAYNTGIPVRRVVCITYVISGMLVGLAGVFYAARLNSTGTFTGWGLEMTALTAAVLGGISLGGGRGSIAKALLGTFIVLIVINSLIRLSMPSGADQLAMGLILLLAVGIDIRWLKNRDKLLSRIYVSPTYLSLPACPPTDAESSSPYAVNNRLKDVEVIGLGELESPEDVILDSNDNLYTGSRLGHIHRFFPPDYKRSEIFAQTGGFPLGLAMDRDDALHVCVAGMGLYKITQDREVIKLSDQTDRSWNSVIDDSRIRMADDLDIAQDGRIFFSDATVRFSAHEWVVDAIESRPNGRLLCYDPKTKSTDTVLKGLIFPNGICVTEDEESLIFAETWTCRIKRFWFDGLKKGRVETIIEDLPGYPDNVNRASDGTFWCALAGMRSPVFDLTQRKPGFRKKMARLVPADEWIFPNVNSGCVIRFDLEGNIIESIWDIGGKSHPQITSMREHKGYLYLGGISNNRIGRYRLKGMDPNWTSQNAYWRIASK